MHQQRKNKKQNKMGKGWLISFYTIRGQQRSNFHVTVICEYEREIKRSSLITYYRLPMPIRITGSNRRVTYRYMQECTLCRKVTNSKNIFNMPNSFSTSRQYILNFTVTNITTFLYPRSI